ELQRRHVEVAVAIGASVQPRDPLAVVSHSDGNEALLRALGDAHLAGVRLDWRALDPGASRIALPTYPFERQRYWVTARSEQCDACLSFSFVAAAAARQARLVPVDVLLDEERRRAEALDGLALDAAAAVLLDLGAFSNGSQTATVESIVRECGVLPVF